MIFFLGGDIEAWVSLIGVGGRCHHDGENRSWNQILEQKQQQQQNDINVDTGEYGSSADLSLDTWAVIR